MAVIVPSRGRPQNVARLIQAWVDTETTAELVVAVDADDPTLDEYTRALVGTPVHVDMVVGPRRRLGGTLNELAPYYAGLPWKDYFQRPACDVIGFMGDDHVPRTLGWDHAVQMASNVDGRAVVYCNDLIQGAALPTAVFLGSTIVRALGYFVPPGAVHLYLDNFWLLLGQKLGTLRYLPDVIIEHMHPLAGRAEWDERYAEVNTDELYASDRLIFEAWQRDEMPAALARVRAEL